MKSFDDFEEYMKADGARVHEAIVTRVNAAMEQAHIEDPIEERVFYDRTFSEYSVMEILRAYHDWLAKS